MTRRSNWPTVILTALSVVLGLAAAPSVAQSGSPFRTVAQVNDSVVTRFEQDQRLRLLQVLGNAGVDADVALEALIDDRLKMQAVDRFGAALSEEDSQLALEEFAGRAGMDLASFYDAIAADGVARETFNDYVIVGASWSNLVRGRFSRAARVSEAELDRALALGAGGGNVQVLVTEIVLPMTPQTARISAEQAEFIQNIDSFDDFSSAARQVSISPSAQNGGRLNWLNLSQLPPQIAPIFLSMSVGEVTAPVPVGNGQAIALFQLRALKDARPSLNRDMDITYARIALQDPAQAEAEIARIAPLLETCDSLYALYPEADEDRLEQIETTRAQLGGLKDTIDQLDPGEVAALPDGTALVMLCNRSARLGEDLSRDDLRRRLFRRNLEDLSDSFLAELRANAFVERQ